MTRHVMTVTITGAQGVGKTRLAQALQRVAADLGFACDVKREGAFCGGTYQSLGSATPRILIEEKLS